MSPLSDTMSAHGGSSESLSTTGIKRARSDSTATLEPVSATRKKLDLAYRATMQQEKQRYDQQVDALLRRSTKFSSTEYSEALTALMESNQEIAKALEQRHNAAIVNLEALCANETSHEPGTSIDLPPSKRIKISRALVTVVVGRERKNQSQHDNSEEPEALQEEDKSIIEELTNDINDEAAQTGEFQANSGEEEKEVAASVSESHPDNDEDDDNEEGVQEFEVDKTLLCSRSPFFQAAFNGPWQESMTNSVSLPEQSPASFAIYIRWIYRELITVEVTQEQDVDESPELLPLYALAEAIQDQDFADAVVDASIRSYKLHLTWYLCSYSCNIYRVTPTGSPMRSLHVDMLLFGGHDVDIRDEKLPRDFVHDMFERLSSTYLSDTNMRAGFKSKSTFTFHLDACRYHHHTRTGKSCYKTRSLQRFVVVEKPSKKSIE